MPLAATHGEYLLPDVCFSVVTVLYNSNAVVFDMLSSIPPGIEIILVDNGNDSPDLSKLPSGAKYFKSGKNIGFGQACNFGAEAATGDFILFLNPDAILMGGFFDALRIAVNNYADCSAFCAATYVQSRLHFQNITWIECKLKGERPAMILDTNFSGDCCVRFANGGAFAIRRSLFLEMGGFDPNIFLYFEDDDLSWRLLQSGQPIILVSDAKVEHVLGKSTPPSRFVEFLRGYGKESSIAYLSCKYGLQDRANFVLLKIIKKIIISSLSFNMRRLYHQLGRLKARIERPTTQVD
ncbi:glycosyltransferase family 2 protein [Pleomorphomonas sp. PLEO]|uniref:glycosyltransferase family 2 protein n=1 Tax=Pleomorphomonas sp. PLEO TaxID=3239306 RepID=UPI00351E9FAE